MAVRMKFVVAFTTPRKPVIANVGQCLPDEIKNWNAVHHGAFEEQPAVHALCGAGEIAGTRTQSDLCWR